MSFNDLISLISCIGTVSNCVLGLKKQLCKRE